MSRPIIEVSNLSKVYRLGEVGASSLREEISGFWSRLRGQTGAPSEREFWALRDVSFTVQPGEVVGIIGRNGAGKSTLLKILSRITEPTSGRAVLRGRTASLLEVGTGFHPDLSGRDNIFLNGAILGMTRGEIRAKFDEIVAFAEVEKFIDTPVKRYSSGMYVRLAFAVAAHLDPDILIIDEVLAVGDAAFQRKCLSKVGDNRKHGTTTLIVSHNMAVINNLCTSATLLDRGVVAFNGKPSTVTQCYMISGSAAGGYIAWSDPAGAPGNEIVRLRSVAITQLGHAQPVADVDIASEISIEIAYWNLKAGEALYAALWLHDEQGTFVFSSGSQKYVSATDDTWYGRPRPRGLFSSVCRIPANLLNEGPYTVTAILGTGTNHTELLQEHVVSFRAHDSGEMRKEYYGRWLGVIRPRLAWSTTLVDERTQL